MMATNGIQDTGPYSHNLDLNFSNGAPSDFEVISHSPGSAAQTPASLSQINPLGASVMPVSLTDVTLEQALARIHDLSKENNELRDYLKENNEMINKQYDTLLAWKKKVHDANVQNRGQFEQTKALIVGLRKDNEELLERVRELENSKEEKMKELLGKIHCLEEARLQSEKLASKVRKQAEEKGVSMDELDLNLQDTVVVSVSAETEERITILECQLEDKNNEIQKLNSNMEQLSVSLEQFRGSTDQLLKDVQTLQEIKDDLQKENQDLHERNNELHLQMQGFLSDTKNSINLLDRASNSPFGSSDHGSKADPEPAEVTRLMEQLQKNEEKFRAELAGFRVEVQMEKGKNQKLQKHINDLSQKLQDMTRQHEQEVATLQREHEQKLTAIAQQMNTQKQEKLQSAPNEGDVTSLRSQVLTLISEVHETNTKLTAATDALGTKERRLKEIEERNTKMHQEVRQQRYESQAFIASLQQRLNLAEQAYTQERHQHEITKQNMMELRASFERLVNDYKEMLDTFDQYKTQQERQASSVANHRQMVEKVSVLMAQKMAAEEAVADREETIQSLQEELKSAKREYEDMSAVLQAQAEVYKADFDAERSAREKQVSEKEKVLSDMSDLQLQNQKLIDELESYSRRQMTEMQRRIAPSHQYLQVAGPGGPYGPPAGHYEYPSGPAYDMTSSSDNSFAETVNLIQQHSQNRSPSQGPDRGHPEEEGVTLVCPQCNLVCPDMDTLQIHVIECLDNTEALAATGGGR